MMNKSALHSFSFYTGIVMILVVVTGAAAIIFTPAFNDRLFGYKRVLFVLVLLSYAVYRAFRIKKMLKDHHD